MEPVSITLASVGAVALTEGVKFLYEQAGELLKRWYDRKKDAPATPLVSAVAPLPSSAFAGQLADRDADLDVIGANEDRLNELIGGLRPYVTDGTKPVAATDERLIARVDELRGLFEQALGQRVTFIGERREPSGSKLVGRVSVRGTVTGNATGVKVSSSHRTCLRPRIKTPSPIGSMPLPRRSTSSRYPPAGSNERG